MTDSLSPMPAGWLPSPLWPSAAPFHIEHGTKPEVVLRFLEGPAQARESLGMSTAYWSKVTPFLKQLGLADPQLAASAFGKGLVRIATDAHDVAEVVSAWLMCGHQLSAVYRFSFAYSQVCRRLAEAEEAGQLADPSTRDEMVDTVRRDCARHYGLALDQVAFSADSLRGACHWLRGIDPPALHICSGRRMRFTRRQCCRPVGVVYGLRFLAALRGSRVLHLTDTEMGWLADVLLLDGIPSVSMAVGDAVQQFPELVDAKATTEVRLAVTRV